MSYLRLPMSYLRLTMSHLRLSMSYLRLSMSYLRLRCSTFDLRIPTFKLQFLSLISCCHFDNLTVMGCVQSLENFTYHLPLNLNIKFPNSFPAPTTTSTDASSSLCIDWSQASPEVINNYCQRILSQLPC